MVRSLDMQLHPKFPTVEKQECLEALRRTCRAEQEGIAGKAFQAGQVEKHHTPGEPFCRWNLPFPVTKQVI